MAAPMNLRCTDPRFQRERFVTDGIITASSEEQIRVEKSVEQHFNYIKNIVDVDSDYPVLLREEHVRFLKKGLVCLPTSYQILDASRPWLCYWILHSLELLDETISDELKSRTAQFLSNCQCPDGGFGGGPGQVAHLAPTYAAVKSLCILGTEEAYNVINRQTLLKFLESVKRPDGSFQMHINGEVDIRGVYCALSVASITNLLTPSIVGKAADWVGSCQTYEGGFGGVPGLEAHGGYSFCGFASLVILGKEHLCDVQRLLRWLCHRQMRFEGGFQGRTNKLVDGCYSFWQGGTFPLIHRYLSVHSQATLSMENWLFNRAALQEYLLICCQASSGGLIDKPGTHCDYYHTCYTLSGLSVAQHFRGGAASNSLIIGHPKNQLNPTHPVYNIGLDAALEATQYFNQLEFPSNTSNTTENGEIK